MENRNYGRGGAALVVGGCHVDILGRSSGHYEPATSCPGIVVRRAGGVGRNVAILLGRAGLAVRFASLVGDDSDGRDLVAELVAAGIDVRNVAMRADRRTGRYLAIHDESGELVSAVSDLGIYDDFRVPAEVLAPTGEDVPRIAFADANLPPAALADLARAHGSRLVVDAISRAKARKLSPLLAAGITVVANLTSARILVGREAATPTEAARALDGMGAARAIITGGPAPVAILEAGEIILIPPSPIDVVDVTGTGDAQIAGMLLARAAGADLVRSTEIGMIAARAALSTHGALTALPGEVLVAAWAAGNCTPD